MATTYFLNEQHTETMTGNKLIAYATLNRDELMQVTLKGGKWHEDITVKVVANYSGYITGVTDKGQIVQGWAGMFTVC